MLFSLRLGCKDHFNPEYIDNLICSLNKTEHPIDEVWLASSYGLPPIDECHQYGIMMGNAADKFEKEGITASMQISRTMGHGEDGMMVYGISGVEDLGLEPLTSIDGYKALGKFCWNDEKFQKYI